VYFCGTVQEEIGLKGAEVLTRRVNPQIALCFDVGFGSEQGELNENATRYYPGRGPGIELYDWSASSTHVNIVPKQMVKALEAASARAGIAHQYSIMIDGGTDACMMMYANHGVLTGGISIPQKYLHTTVGVVGVDDVSGAALLVAEYLKGLKSA
jgi:endoglucanase